MFYYSYMLAHNRKQPSEQKQAEKRIQPAQVTRTSQGAHLSQLHQLHSYNQNQSNLHQKAFREPH